ncbi:MAG: hypothetical protein ABIQ13_03430 [Pedococcus sp.]
MGEADRIDATQTHVLYEGPSDIDPLEGRAGSFVAACSALNDAELGELCRFWEGRADLAERDIDRWWCWTVVRFGQRLLANRQESRERPLQWF